MNEPGKNRDEACLATLLPLRVLISDEKTEQISSILSTLLLQKEEKVCFF